MKITYTGASLTFLSDAFAGIPDTGLTLIETTPARMVVQHPVTDMTVTVIGVDMAFRNDNPENRPISGEVTQITFSQNGAEVAVFDTLTWDFVEMIHAIDQFEATGNSFDTLLQAEPLEFDGSAALAGFDTQDLDFTLGNSLTILGSDFADVLTGSAERDIFKAGAGNDSLFGNGGNDRLQAGNGNDHVEGGRGNDRIIGGAGRDTLNGDGGNDRIEGGQGADILNGGKGNDLMFGDNGADMMFGNAGADNIFGGAGTDDINGGKGNDALHGGDGVDLLIGGGGKDSLFGGDGLDSLRGGKGDDTFFGGADTDDMTGGAGADVFVYSNNATDGLDNITDFQTGEDIIRIIDGYSFADLAFQSSGDDGSNTIVTWGATEVFLFDVTAASLSAADFDFI